MLYVKMLEISKKPRVFKVLGPFLIKVVTSKFIQMHIAEKQQHSSDFDLQCFEALDGAFRQTLLLLHF